MRSDLPSGTVTFLFTDVEGSTRLLHELGAERYAEALAAHRRIVRDALARNGGVEVDTQGDAFFVAFPTAPGALAAAREMTDALSAGPIRVRIGVHTGTPFAAEEGYVGADVNRAARIADSGHGGQVLVSATTAALVSPSGSEPQALPLRDLGEHRLKDLSARERIFQLGGGDFPPLKTLHQTNLPVPATPFLGRERELAQVLGLFAPESLRLLTLTGPGGTGKTRLALQAAGELADEYPHGVWWAPLAPLRDPELVLEAAGQALGASDGVSGHIADKRLLLLFDNFEHVVDAASDVASLLAACPNLDVFVTSREPLRVTGEQEYPVPPLAHEEGIGFFLARAHAVRPDLEADGAVSEICRRLDDLPLALELAAARVKALSPRQILDRLEQRLPLLTGGARDLPQRQRTLRATIEWSYDLLAPDEQRLFARLSVFRGGCTLAAAEQMCEATLDSLQALVEKSLLRFSHERYWMLETIGEFATERLEASGEMEELVQRHAEHFLALAEAAAPQLEGGDPQMTLDLLEPEHDNFRAVFDRLEALGKTDLALRLVGALAGFWALRGHFAEGQRRIEGALAAADEQTPARAKALVVAGESASFLGDSELARRRAHEALALHGKLGDARGVALARYVLANCATDTRDWQTARDLMEASVRAFEEVGDEFNALAARRGLAWTYEELGEKERFRDLTEENLAHARALGNQRLEARALGALAMLAADENRLDDAAALMKDSLRIDRSIGNPVFLAVDLARFADVCARRQRGEIAARLLSRTTALRDELDFALESWMVEEYERTLELVQGQLDRDTFERAWHEGSSLPVDEAILLALESCGPSAEERD